MDETYVKVKGRRMYLYRAVDSRGQTIDFLLSAKRDAEAAKRFFRKALVQSHTVNPRTITVDKNAAYPKAATDVTLYLATARQLAPLAKTDRAGKHRADAPAALRARTEFRQKHLGLSA